MASGNFTISTGNSYATAQVVWSSTTDTKTKKASVTATLKIKKTATYDNRTEGRAQGTFTVAGTSGTYDKHVSLYTGANYVTLKTITVNNISYGNSRTKSITISASGGHIGSTTINNISGSKTVSLDPLPVDPTPEPEPEPTPTPSPILVDPLFTVNDTNKMTITIVPYDSSYTHTVEYKLGTSGSWTTIATKTSSRTVTWKPTSDMWTDSLTKACSIRCTTFSGSVQVGTDTRSVTLKIAEYASPLKTVPDPLVTLTWHRDQSKADWGVSGHQLQTFSDFSLVLNKGSGSSALDQRTWYHATLVGVTVWKDSAKIYEGTYSGFTNNTIKNVVQTVAGKSSFSLWLTDSRGVSARVWSTSVECDAYTPPTIKPNVQCRAWRCDEYGNEDANGTYIAGVITGATTYPVGNDITRYRIGFQESGVYIPGSARDVELNETAIQELSAETTGTVVFAAFDELDTRTSPDTTILVPAPVYAIHFLKPGRKGRFFGTAEASQPDYSMYIRNNRILTTADYSTTAWASVSYKTGYSDYSSSDAVKYRRVGDVVFVQGIATNAAEKTNTTDQDTHIIFTLPSGFRPSQRVQFLTQFSNYTTGLITVKANGNVSISRFRDGATGVNLVQDSWINLNFSFSI